MCTSQQSLLWITLLSHIPTLLARGHEGFQHEVVDAVDKRQIVTGVAEVIPINVTVPINATILLNTTISTAFELPTINTVPVATPTEQCVMTTDPVVLSTIFPSPGASPVQITAQSQVVESFIPELTWCVGGPMGMVATRTMTGPPYGNGSTLYTVSVGGTGSCETLYVATATTVCATTLTGLASKVTVTDCDQEITFSSECGFTLETPTPTMVNASLITPAPTVRRMMTYYLAPWQFLTMGETPSDVDIKVCTELDNGELECQRSREVWEVFVHTTTITIERHLQIATTISGPGTLLVETLQAEITDTLVYFNFSTVLHLATEIETETTNRKQIDRSTSTTYLTKVVEYNTDTPEIDTTIGITSTATKYVNGTITMTRLPPRPTDLTFVPIL